MTDPWIGGVKSPNRCEPYVSGLPAHAGPTSLIAIGTPANGRSSPGSTASAAASAPSASTRMKALTRSSSASMRDREASTSSRAVSSPARTREASSVAGRKRRSVAVASVMGGA